MKLIATLQSAFLVFAAAASAQDRFEEAPVRYSESTPQNKVSVLQAEVSSGALRLERDPQHGYLKAILDALEIPLESQVLVFSKTSFQNDYISPENPRALYFNDDTYVGVVPGGDMIEVATADPELGAVFYTMSQRELSGPEVVRRTQDCLQCHSGGFTGGVPGFVVRSVVPDPTGFPILTAGTNVTTHDSPFEERWGGWYVTGTHGSARHMGNVTTERGDPALDVEAGANQVRVDERVDTSKYLTPDSDIVALMVMEHQTEMHNLLTAAAYETRFALRDQAVVDKALGRETATLSDSTRRRIESAGDKLVRYMLFVDEPELEDAVRGTSRFAQVFSERGPRDRQGRSLRELDLEDRLFKYPLSYLIYSPQFDALPAEMKDYVYRRLWDILTGVEATPEFLHLTNAVSRGIREILLETKEELPAYWRTETGN